MVDNDAPDSGDDNDDDGANKGVGKLNFKG